MSKMLAFNALTVPVKGVNLIEASAGTGKTYSIAALFLRLVLIEHIGVDRILVVTFTKAATAELKNRLRARLESAFQILRLAMEYQEQHQGDINRLPERLAELLKNEAFFADYGPDFDDTDYLIKANEQEDLPRLCLRLQAALNQFDHATIYTIHSYCQRLLQDYAFLCQSPFQTELNEDNLEAFNVLAADFWRQHVIHNPALSECVFQASLTPSNIFPSIRRFINRPYIIQDVPTPPDIKTAKKALDDIWQIIADKLPKLYALFTQYPSSNFNGNSMNQQNYCKTVFEPLLQYQQKALNDTLCKKLANFSEESFRKRITKKGPATFEDLAELTILSELAEAYNNVIHCQDQMIEKLHFDLLNYINEAWQQEKKSNSQRGFDDLLVDVYQALQHETYGEVLSQSIAKKWQVALIDEFQDTDPLQYQIFQQSFIANDIPIFLVGDPKQAIYRFRGADIHAYLQAAKDAQHQYTLATNFRSHKQLVKSIAYLFTQKNNPFIMDDIPYIDVQAHRQDSTLSDGKEAILLNWLNQADEDKLNKDVARARSAEASANQIADLLQQGQQNKLLFKGKPLVASDIAILVRSHNEGKEIRQALAGKNIASVMISNDSVFASQEAQAAISLLNWWLNPNKTQLLRHILMGPLFSFKADEILALNENEAALSQWISIGQSAQEIWFNNSIFSAYQFFSDGQNLESHLLSQKLERTLTNIHQVFELLAEESLQHDHPESLLTWLEKQVHAAQNQLSHDGAQLRLESDDSLIQIVTMHASKGLQYPIVFCPFIWDHRKYTTENFALIHDNNNQAILKGKEHLSKEEHDALSQNQLSEDLRLLYVALTRAEERLYLNLAHGTFSQNSILTYLLHGKPEDTPEQVEHSWGKKAVAAQQYKMWDDWIKNQTQEHSIAWVDDIQPIDKMHFQAEAEHYTSRIWEKRPFKWIKNTSFTALTRQSSLANRALHNTENSDEITPTLDAAEIATNIILPEPNTSTANEWDIFHFPKGAHAGLCLHEILEKLNFSENAEQQAENLLLPTLNRYGFDEKWLKAVTEMSNTARLLNLNGFSLSSLPKQQMLPEMGFVIRTESLSWQHFKNYLSQSNLPSLLIDAIDKLNFYDVDGFLNGFIDMTCSHEDGHVTIIDYKSNHLGMNVQDYHEEALNLAMAEHHYYLQALLYAVAVKRYFAIRQISLETIHIKYLFLRGLEHPESQGIWRWDINATDLDNLLI